MLCNIETERQLDSSCMTRTAVLLSKYVPLTALNTLLFIVYKFVEMPDNFQGLFNFKMIRREFSNTTFVSLTPISLQHPGPPPFSPALPAAPGKTF